MPCYHPIKGYRSKIPTVNGKYPFTLDARKGGAYQEIPCGQCIGCRLERSRQWAARILAEASLYEKNCFITLTYSTQNLPENGSLVLEHFQLFMKRLRKKYGSNIRFFHCGEYGEQLQRPHYHACLLNFDFPDKRFHSSTPRGDHTYISPSLADLWSHGIHQIGSLTFESAAYCARYVTKKVTGNASEAHYTRYDPQTGDSFRVAPEYCTMSRRPGIGEPWRQKFNSDVYTFDSFVTRGGVKMRPPRSMDRRFEFEDPEAFQRVQDARLLRNSSFIVKKLVDRTPERLQVQEVVQLATLKATLNRKLEK